MNKTIESEIERDRIINLICDFFHFNCPKINPNNTVEAIKEICIARLCKAIGLTGLTYFKSEFFNFFSCIMGEAICEKLGIKLRIACDELRLVKYNGINLVKEVKSYLDNELVEEAFLDAFDLVDRHKYLIEYLKKSSKS